MTKKNKVKKTRCTIAAQLHQTNRWRLSADKPLKSCPSREQCNRDDKNQYVECSGTKVKEWAEKPQQKMLKK